MSTNLIILTLSKTKKIGINPNQIVEIVEKRAGFFYNYDRCKIKLSNLNSYTVPYSLFNIKDIIQNKIEDKSSIPILKKKII